VVSTVFTLILIPAGFSLVMDARAQAARILAAVRSRLRGGLGGRAEVSGKA